MILVDGMESSFAEMSPKIDRDTGDCVYIRLGVTCQNPNLIPCQRGQSAGHPAVTNKNQVSEKTTQAYIIWHVPVFPHRRSSLWRCNAPRSAIERTGKGGGGGALLVRLHIGLKVV